MSDIKMMTEEQIGKMICFAYWEDGEGADLFDQFIDEYRSLKGTVETQKGQLETCKEAIEALVEDHHIKKAKTDDWIQKVETEARGYMKLLSDKKPDISSLITTIESQKEEIEKKDIVIGKLFSALDLIGESSVDELSADYAKKYIKISKDYLADTQDQGGENK